VSKYSTNTGSGSDTVVPWLAATGPLAYTPDNPPDRDYYFQYDRVLPHVLSRNLDLKMPRYFGAGSKHAAADVFEFWKDARSGRHVKVHVKNGQLSPDSIATPIAVYLHRAPNYWRGISYLLIQHGSYLFVSRKSQPEMEDGIIYLYRGIQKTETFHYPRFDFTARRETDTDIWRAYWKMQSFLLSDSALSFISMHERINRCETGGLNSSSNVNLEAATSARFNCYDGGLGHVLWKTHHQCFSLERFIAERKFGPNFAVLKTPLTNVRITTFFAGEAEAKVVDPAQARFVEVVGCEFCQTTVPLPEATAVSCNRASAKRADCRVMRRDHPGKPRRS